MGFVASVFQPSALHVDLVGTSKAQNHCRGVRRWEHGRRLDPSPGTESAAARPCARALPWLGGIAPRDGDGSIAADLTFFGLRCRFLPVCSRISANRSRLPYQRSTQTGYFRFAKNESGSIGNAAAIAAKKSSQSSGQSVGAKKKAAQKAAS